MKKNKLPKHLEESMANLKFCIEHCGMNDEEIEEMLKAIDKLKRVLNHSQVIDYL